MFLNNTMTQRLPIICVMAVHYSMAGDYFRRQREWQPFHVAPLSRVFLAFLSLFVLVYILPL